MPRISPAIVFLALLLLVHPAAADVTPRATVERQLYGIRGSFFGATANEGNGLWAWDPDGAAWRRLHPLTYGYRGTGERAAVTGTADTVIVQGTTFLEFDPVSQRLLRRYPALPPAQAGWAFKGEYVGAERAAQLGIPTGFYGFAYCPDNNVQSGPPCKPTEFPGGVTLSIENASQHFYHRSDDGKLTLLKVLPEGSRSLALDATRRRFWFVQRPVLSRFELGYLPLIGSTIGDPVITDVQELNLAIPGTVGDLLYDPTDDALLALHWLAQPGLASRPADLSRPFQPVDLQAGGIIPTALTKLEATLPATYTQVVPAIGNGPGANGTYWRSDLWLFNPSDVTTEVVLRRVAKPDVTRTIALAARASVELRDVLAMLGGGPAEIGGDGTVTDALVVNSAYRWGAQLVAFSRNYTPATDGRGNYGQAIPAVPTRRGYSTHLYQDTGAIDTGGEAPEFFLDLRVPGQFRHNLGVVNDDAEPLLLDLYYGNALSSGGATPPTHRLSIAAHSVANISLEAVISPEMRATRPSMMKIAASRPAPVWLSMIDNKTGDATFLPFALFAMPGAADATMTIPQIAHTPGANGTFWRSDLYWEVLPVPGAGLQPARFYPADPSRCGGHQMVEGMLEKPIADRVFPDVMSQFNDCTTDGTMGALELKIGSWMAGFTRTYTTRPDGGTYGDILPFYPVAGWPIQHFSGLTVNSSFRINLGLYNGLDHRAVHELLIYDAAGNEVRRGQVTLEPRRSVQALLSSFVGAIGDGLYGLTVRPLDESGAPGRSWAYIAIVDNATGDTTNLW